jgi:hypothetical protein
MLRAKKEQEETGRSSHLPGFACSPFNIEPRWLKVCFGLCFLQNVLVLVCDVLCPCPAQGVLSSPVCSWYFISIVFQPVRDRQVFYH